MPVPRLAFGERAAVLSAPGLCGYLGCCHGASVLQECMTGNPGGDFPLATGHVRAVLASDQPKGENREVAHIPHDVGRDTQYVRVPLDMAMPSGWMCPGCGHSYAPWVPECHHCPEQPAFIAKENDPGPIETGA
jgi:hypothetical protein